MVGAEVPSFQSHPWAHEPQIINEMLDTDWSHFLRLAG
jgi:hypothetical protein